MTRSFFPPSPSSFPLRPAAALLDLDGTLADTAAGIHAAGARMLAALGLPPVSFARARGFIGDGMPRFVKRLLTGEAWANPDAALFARAGELMARHYARECEAPPPLYPGTRAALEALTTAGVALACATNKPRRFALPLLAAAELDAFFNATVCGDDAPEKKPAPAPLLRACELLGVAPRRAVMVGDSATTDLRAAQAAGCEFVGVSYGYGTAPFPPGTWVVDSLEELAAALTGGAAEFSGRGFNPHPTNFRPATAGAGGEGASHVVAAA